MYSEYGMGHCSATFREFAEPGNSFYDGSHIEEERATKIHLFVSNPELNLSLANAEA